MFGIFKKRKSQPIAQAESRFLNEWLSENGFNTEDVRFSIYDDPNLMHEGSTCVVVGYGKSGGEFEGFSAELSDARLIEARMIHPGAASYHKQAAAEANYAGERLMGRLLQKSLKMKMR